MRVAEAVAAYKEASKEGDEAGKALFGETEDEVEDNAGSDESPLCWHRRRPAPPTPLGTNNEAEDTAGSAEAPPRRLQGGGPTLLRPRPANNEAEGHRRLSRGSTLPATRGRISPAPPRRRPAGNETEDIAGSVEAPPCCQRGYATQKTRKSRTR